MGGDPYELWVGGSHAGSNSFNETMRYATGYENMKYYLGSSDYLRQNTQWVALRLSDLYFAVNSRSEEHTSELQSREYISYAVFCLKKIFF